MGIEAVRKFIKEYQVDCDWNECGKYFASSIVHDEKKINNLITEHEEKIANKLLDFFETKKEIKLIGQKKISNKKEIYLGDIIISFNYMNNPKNLDKDNFKKKTIKIFIHGFLHLLGYDHSKYKDYKKMFNEEQKVFKSIEKLLN